MANSFLLRDKRGCIGGYVIMRADEVSCRITTQTGGDRLCIEHIGGIRKLDMAQENIEQRFAANLKSAFAAYICAGGCCVLASDWDRAEICCCACEDRRIAEPGKAEPHAGAGYKENICSAERHWPERRWPPPCCTPARYEHGRWLIDS